MNFFKTSQQSCINLSEIPSTENPLYFALLRQWFRECDKNHRCNRKALFWPTRVIFVGGPDSAELELWETELKKRELSNADGYTALSHCWGNPTDEEKQRFCTTQENYERRLKRFSMNDLPKTFKDAIRVTRELGKQYLWIDALCIIQPMQEEEEDSDWKREAGCMANVFGGAYCTFAASSARSWKEGFLERESTPCYVKAQQKYSRRWKYICNDVNNFENDVDEGPINQRAWVLQERVLSRRTIHFTERHIYWECGQGVWCENLKKLQR